MPPLLRANEVSSTFVGYDAIRVTATGDAIGNRDRKIAPGGMSDDQFNVTLQKLDYQNYMVLSGVDDFAFRDFLRYDPSGFPTSALKPLDTIIDTDLNEYGSYNLFLLNAFGRFWGRAGLEQLERTYHGVGLLGAKKVKQLDRLEVDNTRYTIIDIERDLVKNEMKTISVEYPGDEPTEVPNLRFWIKGDQP
jgi:hypothetical protein